MFWWLVRSGWLLEGIRERVPVLAVIGNGCTITL